MSECREIEQARCAAAEACGAPNVDECQRYYRDHCLHGLPRKGLDLLLVDGCVADLGKLGACATQQGSTVAVSACAEPISTSAGGELVCDVVRRPELASACSFLAPPVTPPVTPAPAPSVSDAGSP